MTPEHASRPRWDTRPLTLAWTFTLVVVGALAVVSVLLGNAALATQRTAAEATRDAATQEVRAAQIAAAADRIVQASDPGVRAVAHSTLRDLLPAAEEADAALRGRTVRGSTTAEAQDHLRSPWGEMREAGVELLALAEADAPLSRSDERTLASRVSSAATVYGSRLALLTTAFETDAAQDLARTTNVQRALLLAIVALLAVEVFLVFRPATRRIQQNLEHRSREAERERRRTQRQLESLARLDHLTGLANRVLFRDRLDHAVAAARRSRSRVAVMFLDLDKFKDVNDQFGHDAGDQLLVGVSERLRSIARASDTVARLGGDEFTVVLEGLDAPDGAATVAKKILESLAAPFSVGGHQLQVTTSIGIALYPDDADRVEDLLRHADSAMYEAKSAGRNNYQFSTPALREANVARLRMIDDLRRAVDDGHLRLVYQPQVSTRTGEVTGLEALVRWVRPDGSEVPAAEFIDVVEDTDVMPLLGAWVVRAACQQAVSWEGGGDAPLSVAVNLSGRQFRQADLATVVAGALNETGLAPERLEVEVTEATLLDDVDASHAILRLLRGIGVRLVIDNFGIGYTSLHNLTQFPIDRLKIDGSFLESVTTASGDAPVAAAITDMAHHIGLDTTAMGVETADQLAVVARIGCDRAQGFHLSPPVPAERLPAVLAERTTRVRRLPRASQAG